MKLIKGLRNDYTGKVTWEKEAYDIDLDSLDIMSTKYFKASDRTIYYTRNFHEGGQSKNNPYKDQIQEVYKTK